MATQPDLELLLAIVQRLPDPLNIGLFVVEQYRGKFGYYPNILQPSTFNEKIQSRKLFDRRPILQIAADKYAVRAFVAARLGETALPVLHHVTADPEDLPFAALPDRYVVKATHGSGWIHIVKDRADADEALIRRLCRSWLDQNFYEQTLEWAYRDIPPRILVEEFLDNGAGEPAEDYKLFTFNGRVEYIQVDVGRFTDHRKSFFDRDWRPVALRQECENFPGLIARPGNLAALIEAAETLAAGIDFVRVDLYSVQDRIYFGELTMTPGNGYFRFEPASFDESFGRLWRMEIGPTV